MGIVDAEKKSHTISTWYYVHAMHVVFQVPAEATSTTVLYI